MPLELCRPMPPADGSPALHLRLIAARQRLDQAAEMFGRGQIDAKQLATVSSGQQAEVAEITARMAEQNRHNALAAFSSRDPAEVWAGLSLEGRRAVITTLMRVTVLPAPRGRRTGWQPGTSYFNPDAVQITWRQ